MPFGVLIERGRFPEGASPRPSQRGDPLPHENLIAPHRIHVRLACHRARHHDGLLAGNVAQRHGRTVRTLLTCSHRMLFRVSPILT